MSKSTVAALLFTILSPSAFSANGIVEQTFDVLNYGNVEQVSMVKSAGREHWDVSYDYAEKSGEHYDVKLRVKPLSNPLLAKQPVAPQTSELIVGPFKMPVSLEAFNRFSEEPSELADFLVSVLPMIPIDIFGTAVKVNVKDITYNEESMETIVSFNFDNKENIEMLPVTAGFAGIWVEGSRYPTMIASVSAGEMDSDFVCDNTIKKCSTRLFGTSDAASQLFPVTTK